MKSNLKLKINGMKYEKFLKHYEKCLYFFKINISKNYSLYLFMKVYLAIFT